MVEGVAIEGPPTANHADCLDYRLGRGIGLERQQNGAAALDRLSPEQREAVVLKIYQGFKFEEMAEILSCPVSTVKSRLYSALELLKVELAPIGTRGVS